MCKSHENGCTWSLGTYNSRRHKKWIIKSIRGHRNCLVPMLIEDHHQLDKHVIGQIIKPIVKTNPTVSIKTLTFMNYAPSYKKRGDNFSVGFFLKKLRRHVNPQSNISLILDRHTSIISSYNNPSNLWVQDISHFICLRHIAQNFLPGNSNGKHMKKPLMQAGENL
ncbi:hypothetical protein GmHk_17G049528 [Glycine max]|nr:hypothetical protein GmHk_17G049528 [Glycine max]